MFVLIHNETGKYVAMPGVEHSYTDRLEDTRVFQSRQTADYERCVESEQVARIYTAGGRLVVGRS